MRRSSRKRGASVNLQPGRYNLRSAPGLIESDQVGTTKMAYSFESRNDPEYLKSMEDELIKSRQAREEETKLLQSLVARMDKLDMKPAPGASMGRGILRTPLKSGSYTETGIKPGVPSMSPHSLSGLLQSDLGVLSDPTPSDVINGPLTKVLQQLSVAIDPTPQSSTKGLLLRPEYYIQHKDKGVAVKNLDHSKLTFKELMSGMGRVMLHLAKTGGELISYIEHFNYLVRQAGVHNFTDAAYVSYDRHVVDQYINGDSKSFNAGDLFGVALHFHAGNLASARPSFVRGRGRGYRRGGYRQQGWQESDKDRDNDRNQHQPPSLEGFPEDVCYGYNYRSCSGKCSKSHVCRLCRGLHKATSGQ